MTTIGMRQEAGAHTTRHVSIVQTALLAFGVISSVLYIAIDLLAGLNYDGYSFWSQTISELGAAGASTPSWLAPAFLTYSALMFFFAATVAYNGTQRGDKIRNIGLLLLLYMIVGSGTAFFPVHVRGTAELADEMPHIISGLAAVVVILVTIAVGSTAFGRRFLNFSRLAFAMIVVFGTLTVPSAMKLAAGQPTPGMGILERLAYYSILVWIAGLSLTLLHRGRELTPSA